MIVALHWSLRFRTTGAEWSEDLLSVQAVSGHCVESLKGTLFATLGLSFRLDRTPSDLGAWRAPEHPVKGLLGSTLANSMSPSIAEFTLLRCLGVHQLYHGLA